MSTFWIFKNKILFPLMVVTLAGSIATPLLLNHKKTFNISKAKRNLSSVDWSSWNAAFSAESIEKAIKAVEEMSNKQVALESEDLRDSEPEFIAPSENEKKVFLEALNIVMQEQSKRLSKDQREVLQNFYVIYSQADPNKSKVTTGPATEVPGLPVFELYKFHLVLDDLEKLNWEREKLTLKKNEEESENWGWPEWINNPFNHFYSSETAWKEKMKQFSNNLEPEIEKDISIWLIQEMIKSYKSLSSKQ